jgi:hypothetical protein
MDIKKNAARLKRGVFECGRGHARSFFEGTNEMID